MPESAKSEPDNTSVGPMTCWQCPDCGTVRRVGAYELAETGTPYCPNCQDGSDVEMIPAAGTGATRRRIENVPCSGCGRKDLPLHTDGLCPECSPKGCCQRCGTPLSTGGYCADETCPFHDHRQHCPRGWIGHPEKAPDTSVHGLPCNCDSLDACGTEEDCPTSPSGKHEPDPTSIAPADGAGRNRGTDWIVDICCRHCGSGGSLRIEPGEIQW